MTFNVLQHFGIKDEAVNTFKPKASAGRILLYDGDAACYQITSDVKKLDTALRRFEQDILSKMYLTQCSQARVHLTPRGCLKRHRDKLNTVKPYQGDREGKAKPPLLEIMRSQAEPHFGGHSEITVIGNHFLEADDAIIIDAYEFGNTCTVSFDKDLRVNPFQSYDWDEGKFLNLNVGDTFGWVERKHWLTASGAARSKLIGKGTKFFWGQMIMGDTADNVKGLIKYKGKACGEATAMELLDPIKDESECANFVIDAYREINQNVVAEGEAMWLVRNHDDSAYKYMLSLDLSPQNKQFVEDTNATAWRDEDECN